MAAFVALLPCVSFQEDSAYEAYSVGTPCVNGRPSTSSLVTALTGASFLVVTGPMMWAFIIRRSRDWWQPSTRKAILGFLVKGYKDDFEWWEATVLSRNMLVQATAAKIPASYAPGRLCMWLLFIMLCALLAQYFRPYKKTSSNKAIDDSNFLDFGTLMVSSMALVLSSCTLTPWFGESDVWWFTFVTPMYLILCATFVYLSV